MKYSVPRKVSLSFTGLIRTITCSHATPLSAYFAAFICGRLLMLIIIQHTIRLTCTLSLAVLSADCSNSVASALSSAALRPRCLRMLCVTGDRTSALGRSLDGVYAGLLIELIDLSSRLVADAFLGGLEADAFKLRSRFDCAVKGDDVALGDRRGCISQSTLSAYTVGLQLCCTCMLR